MQLMRMLGRSLCVSLFTVLYIPILYLANESADYTAQMTVRFAGAQNRACVAVPIVNDGEVEGDETFYISLSEDPNSPLDSRIRLTPKQTTVTILDDDG